VVADRSVRIGNDPTVSDRLAANRASSRGNAVNARKRDANNQDEAGKTLNRAASKLARSANAQIGIVSKPSPAVKARSKAESNPNLDGKVADSGAGAAAEDVADPGKTELKAIAVIVVAVGSRIESVDGIAIGNRNARIARRPKCVRNTLS